MTFQLIYQSQAIHPRGDLSDRDILNEAITRNKGFHVTGFLARTPRGFVQLLEGEQTAVQGLYAMIVRDHRHMCPQVLRQQQVTHRLFADWHMGYADTDMAWLHEASVTDVLSAMQKLADTEANRTRAASA